MPPFDIPHVFRTQILSADEGFRLLLRFNRGNLSRFISRRKCSLVKEGQPIFRTDGSVVTSSSLKMIFLQVQTWPGASHLQENSNCTFGLPVAQFPFRRALIVLLDYGRSLSRPHEQDPKLSSRVIQKIREFLKHPRYL